MNNFDKSAFPVAVVFFIIMVIALFSITESRQDKTARLEKVMEGVDKILTPRDADLPKLEEVLKRIEDELKTREE